MTTTEQVIALLKRLVREKNGAVTDAMDERGTHYGLNYGVSLPTIRDIASEYAPDQELACALQKQGVRELQLAALFVADPEQMTAAEMERWSTGWITSEMAEQSAMQLFWRSPEASDLFTKWTRPDAAPLKRLAAFYMIGRRASSEDISTGLIPEIFENAGEASAAYALREIYRHRPELQEQVTTLLASVQPSVAEEVKWQIEYL